MQKLFAILIHQRGLNSRGCLTTKENKGDTRRPFKRQMIARINLDRTNFDFDLTRLWCAK